MVEKPVYYDIRSDFWKRHYEAAQDYGTWLSSSDPEMAQRWVDAEKRVSPLTPEQIEKLRTVLSDISRQHPTPGQLRQFRDGRKSGVISFFRACSCARCAVEIPLKYTYCSARCQQAHAQEQEQWMAMFGELTELLKKRVKVETTDGCYRTGVLSAVVWHQVKVGDGVVEIPQAIRLDNEPGDELPWPRLLSIDPAD